MNRGLPDVDVLLALVWPRHEGHAAAQDWFRKSGHRAWATSPLTELGVLRLLTNPAVTQGAVSVMTAVEALAEVTRHAGHEFWPLDQPMPVVLQTLAGRVRGHRRWTDAILLSQAVDRNGVLVTLDSGVKQLAPRDLTAHVLVLKGP